MRALTRLLFICLLATSIAGLEAKDAGLDSVDKLELAGSDSFDYDINNKIRRAKSNFNIGIGFNVSKIIAPGFKYGINVSTLAGYSYFFHKTFGLRVSGIFDYLLDKFYGGGGVDVLWDFVQTEPFGMGISFGANAGYSKMKALGDASGFLVQADAGLSLVFDGGKSRLELLARIPLNKIDSSIGKVSPGPSYVVLYLYSF